MRKALLLLLVPFSAACAHRGPTDIATLASASDRVVFEAGQKAAAKRNWESARQHFKRVVDGFPQSEYGPAARLGLGDSYFKNGGTANYILAVAQYRDFLTLFPSHPQADYAQYQVAESYFQQKNGPDRDQTATEKALQEYERLLALYPASTYLETTRSRIVTCRQSLARAEFMVGFFYQRTRKACRAAVTRYQNLLSVYPDYEKTDEVLLRLAECLAETGRPAEALPNLARLTGEFPQSRYASAAQRLTEKLLSQVPAAPTPPAASPSPEPEK